MNVFINVNNKDYQIQFGHGSNKILARKWGLTTLSKFGKAIEKRFDFAKLGEPTFQQWDYIGDLILSGILYLDPAAKVTTDQIIEATQLEPNKLLEIIGNYADTISKNAKKPNPAKK